MLSRKSQIARRLSKSLKKSALVSVAKKKLEARKKSALRKAKESVRSRGPKLSVGSYSGYSPRDRPSPYEAKILEYVRVTSLQDSRNLDWERLWNPSGHSVMESESDSPMEPYYSCTCGNAGIPTHSVRGFCADCNPNPLASTHSLRSGLGSTSQPSQPLPEPAPAQPSSPSPSSSPTDSKPQECVICCSSVSTHIILPCLHLCICGDCAKTAERRLDKCPNCRTKIKSVKRVYF